MREYQPGGAQDSTPPYGDVYDVYAAFIDPTGKFVGEVSTCAIHHSFCIDVGR